VDTRRPQYELVRRRLASDIASGSLAAGALLPSEVDLASRFQVSRVTVRRALALLKADGLVGSRQGYGWFVGRSPVIQSLDVLAPIDEHIARAGSRPERKLLRFAYAQAPETVASVLWASSILEISRLNLADGRPVGRNTAFIDERLARGLSLDAVERDSLHRLLPVNVTSATQTISATASSAADAELLQVAVGSPLLRFDRTTRDDVGRPVIYSEAVYNPELTEFSLQLHVDPPCGAARLNAL